MTTEPTLSPLRIGVLGSGKGSNFKAIAAQIAEGKLNAEIAVVLSDVAGAGILEYAREMGIPAIAFDPGKFRTKLEPEIEAKVAAIFEEHRVELVVLAGFMRIVKHDLLTKFSRRIINIHPSLLPKHRGLHAWEQALLAGDNVTGCTVHYVDRGIDTGEIIAQAEVPVEPGDVPETLHARIQAAEHELYPRVIAGFCENRSPEPE
ncbi:MAG TPA: phosphoribosylglycinamide formyltransferase [Chthoniobacterales bacterium]